MGSRGLIRVGSPASRTGSAATSRNLWAAPWDRTEHCGKSTTEIHGLASLLDRHRLGRLAYGFCRFVARLRIRHQSGY